METANDETLKAVIYTIIQGDTNHHFLPVYSQYENEGSVISGVLRVVGAQVVIQAVMRKKILE